MRTSKVVFELELLPSETVFMRSFQPELLREKAVDVCNIHGFTKMRDKRQHLVNLRKTYLVPMMIETVANRSEIRPRNPYDETGKVIRQFLQTTKVAISP